jgi:hypothetical protein
LLDGAFDIVTLGFTSPFHPAILSSHPMDKFWSILTMPIGVALCFGPAIIVWWLTRDKEPRDDKSDSH